VAVGGIAHPLTEPLPRKSLEIVQVNQAVGRDGVFHWRASCASQPSTRQLSHVTKYCSLVG